jgi:hypothetical protein
MSTSFYNKANLPDHGDADGWKARMLYRVFLRSEYSSCIWRYNERVVLRFGLINEMSLYPRGAVPEDAQTPCLIKLLKLDGTIAYDLRIDMCAAELDFAGFTGGRGSCSIAISSEGNATTRLLLQISFGPVPSPQYDSLHVMPLVFGPITLTNGSPQITGDEMLEFYRPLALPATTRPLLIREQPELAIPGKIWDSALFASEVALELAMQRPVDAPCNVLDLSCGTGVCGLWLSAALQAQGRSANIVLTDLEEALPVIRNNINHCKPTMPVEALPLSWADERNLQRVFDTLTKLDTPSIDIVVACDLIYEAEHLALLAATLRAIATTSVRPTTIIIGYKQRGLTHGEKENLWLSFQRECGFFVKRMHGASCKFMLPRCVDADYIGVELWLLSMDEHN